MEPGRCRSTHILATLGNIQPPLCEPQPQSSGTHLRRQLPRHHAAGDQGEVRGGVEEADDGPHGGDEQRHGVAARGEWGLE